MKKAIKVMLLPNNKQRTKLFESAGTARWAYNWALNRQNENYKSSGYFINNYDLRKELTQLKKSDDYKWLCDYSCHIPKQAIKDVCDAFERFFKKQNNYPNFKSKKKSNPSFYQDTSSIQIKTNKVFLSNIGWIKLAEKNRFPVGKAKNKEISVSNPRITFDGIKWWITIGVECERNFKISMIDGIGIDLGIKNLAICSDGNLYENINKTKKVKKIKNKQLLLQRKISKKYTKNKRKGSYCKTKNIIKSEQKLLKIYHRLKNIRINYLQQTTTEIIKRKPSFIVLEDLDVKSIMKNKYLSKYIQEQGLYEFFREIQYKCEWNNIRFIVADRYFPSSKLCSECGSIKKDLKLSDRVYVCFECGNVIDRDYQASINLMNYGKVNFK